MYQTQSSAVIFNPLIPQTQSIIPAYTTQSFINQVPQPTQFITTESYIPQPQVQAVIPQAQAFVPVQTVVPQTQSFIQLPQTQTFIPQAQSIVPQAQSVIPAQNLVTSFAPMPQGSMITPYVQPIGSRHPFAQSHMSIGPNSSFADIGGSPYGRISTIK